MLLLVLMTVICVTINHYLSLFTVLVRLIVNEKSQDYFIFLITMHSFIWFEVYFYNTCGLHQSGILYPTAQHSRKNANLYKTIWGSELKYHCDRESVIFFRSHHRFILFTYSIINSFVFIKNLLSIRMPFFKATSWYSFNARCSSTFALLRRRSKSLSISACILASRSGENIEFRLVWLVFFCGKVCSRISSM